MVITLLLLQITLALYALSFAQYLESIYPGVPIKWVALTLMTILFIVNIIGVKSASYIGNLMVVVLIVFILLHHLWFTTYQCCCI